jgi:hypothetical protein
LPQEVRAAVFTKYRNPAPGHVLEPLSSRLFEGGAIREQYLADHVFHTGSNGQYRRTDGQQLSR